MDLKFVTFSMNEQDPEIFGGVLVYQNPEIVNPYD